MAKIDLIPPGADADAEEVRAKLAALIRELNRILRDLDEENMSDGYNRKHK